MRACKYSTTPKGEDKHTRIIQKGGIIFYRKRRELSHRSGILHLADKVSPTFRKQKNGVKNATATQWRTTKTLCQVKIWDEIIIRLDLYLGKTSVTPVNTVWLESHKTTITSQMTTNSLRAGPLLCVRIPVFLHQRKVCLPLMNLLFVVICEVIVVL